MDQNIGKNGNQSKSIRDNFSKKTVDILGKRVGFICSNPSCRKPTIGPNEDLTKATLIGIAAHITAAFSGGPRFNRALAREDREHIDNGIWLCTNCATLIDKDEKRYSPDRLKKWKNDAESSAYGKLVAGNTDKDSTPYLEADLIWKRGGRRMHGYSTRNPKVVEDGIEIYSIGPTPICHYELFWEFRFVIHNNSSVPAFNLQVEESGTKKLAKLTQPAKVNNLPPFRSVDLDLKYQMRIEDDYREADRLQSAKIPEELIGVNIKITYQDNERRQHTTLMKITPEGIINEKS